MIAPIDVTNIRIETDRLILRPWRESDLTDFYEYASVDGVGQMARWMPHASIDETKAILGIFIAGKKTLAIAYKENGKIIGSISFDEQEDNDRIPQELCGRELGYALNKCYWGLGLMPETVLGICEYCFKTLNFDYLTVGHFNFNMQSRRVVEKCGFTFIEETVFETRMGTQEKGRYYIHYNPYK